MPRVIDRSKQARGSAVAQSLASIRDALDMYRATYNRLPPGDTTTCDLPSALDDFLQGMTFPIGTKGSNAVINFTGAPTVQAGPFGWVYSVDEGAIVINSPERVDWD